LSAALKRAMALLDGTMAVSEVARRAHCTVNNLSEQLKRQHKAGTIHIAAWKKTNGRNARCYMLGPGEDAPALPETKNTTRWRAFMDRMSAYEREIYMERRRTAARKVKTDPLVKQFFGGER
jgi:hypothetical protein